MSSKKWPSEKRKVKGERHPGKGRLFGSTASEPSAWVGNGKRPRNAIAQIEYRVIDALGVPETDWETTRKERVYRMHRGHKPSGRVVLQMIERGDTVMTKVEGITREFRLVEAKE